MKILPIISHSILALLIGILIGKFYFTTAFPEPLCPKAEDFNDRFTTMTNLLCIPEVPHKFVNGQQFSFKEIYADIDYIITKLQYGEASYE